MVSLRELAWIEKRLANSPFTCTHCKNRRTTPVAAIPHVMVRPKQVAEKCSLGLHCPICKNEEEHKEDWNCDMKREQPRLCPQDTQHPQPQSTQHPQHQNTQHPQSFDVPDRYSEQIRLRKEWEEKIECLNRNYNPDYYSSSESDSDSKLEPEYKYEHKYETFIGTILWSTPPLKIMKLISSLLWTF